MRYTLDQCLFSHTNTTTEPPANQCTAPCAGISSPLQTNLLTPNESSTYDYCADPAFLQNVEGCVSCYRVISHQIYLSNCETLRSSVLLYILITCSPQYPLSSLSIETFTSLQLSHRTFKHLHLSATLQFLHLERYHARHRQRCLPKRKNRHCDLCPCGRVPAPIPWPRLALRSPQDTATKGSKQQPPQHSILQTPFPVHHLPPLPLTFAARQSLTQYQRPVPTHSHLALSSALKTRQGSHALSTSSPQFANPISRPLT